MLCGVLNCTVPACACLDDGPVVEAIVDGSIIRADKQDLLYPYKTPKSKSESARDSHVGLGLLSIRHCTDSHAE